MGQELGETEDKGTAPDAPGEYATVPKRGMQRNGAVNICFVSAI
jgi:hypothetical protein